MMEFTVSSIFDYFRSNILNLNMKIFLIYSVVFLTVKAGVSYRDLLTQEWKLFKETHGKSYESQEEDAKRMKIFLENKLFVAEHNERFHRGEETFDVELNKFSDWLPEEIDALHGFNRQNRLLANEEPAPLPELKGERFLSSPNVTLPDEVNWVKAGAVTSVKDQKTCGSCYAFSAVGSLEGQMFLKKKKRLESLSVQNIVDCSRPQGNQGCNGGFAHFSFEYVRKNNGLNTEEVYPYESKQGTCRFKSNNIGATCTGYVQVEQSEKRLQEAVATVGPIAINLDTRHKSFQMYKSGVYSEPKCHPYTLVHAVLLVGYGVDSTTKKEYWLVKNSWSPTWGDKGYIKIARNANNMCGIASLATYPKV